MKDILRILSLIGLPIGLICLMQLCEPKDPYEEGMHMDYSIICEDGFKYKCLGSHRGTIPILNSDGTPLKCNQKRY